MIISKENIKFIFSLSVCQVKIGFVTLRNGMVELIDED